MCSVRSREHSGMAKSNYKTMYHVMLVFPENCICGVPFTRRAAGEVVWLPENSPPFLGHGRGSHSPLTVAQFSRECHFAVLKNEFHGIPLSWVSPRRMPLLPRQHTPVSTFSLPIAASGVPSLPPSCPSSEGSNATSVSAFTFSPALSP